MIELKNVSKYYNNNGVVSLGLRNVNLKFEEGEIVAIVGDSGSGKSTLLNVITAVDTYDEGEIYFNGEETSYFNQNDMDEFRKKNVAFIFQNYNIIESYTVLENVMVPLLINGKSHKEAEQEARKIIDKVGLTSRINNKGTKLSGGEKQRCVIARAIASEAKILACDEPTGNLDSSTGEKIIDLIKEVAKNKLVLIVTHNYSQVKNIATRTITMLDGEVVEDNKIKETSIVEEDNIEGKPNNIHLKTLFRFSWLNLFSTPKKSIFSLGVFFVIFSITLLLALLALQFSYETGFIENSKYSLIDKDRAILYEKNHQQLEQGLIDKTKDYEAYANAFYEETVNTFWIAHYGKVELKVTCHNIDYTIIYGDEPENDDDLVIIVPEDSSSKQKSNYSKYVDLRATFNNSSFGMVRAIGTSPDVRFPYVIRKGGLSNEFINTLYNSMVVPYYSVDGGEDIRMNVSTRIVSDKTYISCPLKYKDRFDVKFFFDDVYQVWYDIEIVYEDEINSITPTLIIVDDFEDGQLAPDFKGVYELTVYHDDVDELKKFAKDDTRLTIPSRYEVVSTVNLVYLYAFIAILIIALIGLFFMSYVILSRVYSSRKKDYAILRTLGMLKKQLSQIVKIEIITIGLFCSIICYTVTMLIGMNTNLLPMVKYNNFYLSISYFLVTILFSYLIARRFNKKLFKFNVNQTLKDEVIKND